MVAGKDKCDIVLCVPFVDIAVAAEAAKAAAKAIAAAAKAVAATVEEIAGAIAAGGWVLLVIIAVVIIIGMIILGVIGYVALPVAAVNNQYSFSNHTHPLQILHG